MITDINLRYLPKLISRVKAPHKMRTLSRLLSHFLTDCNILSQYLLSTGRKIKGLEMVSMVGVVFFKRRRQIQVGAAI